MAVQRHLVVLPVGDGGLEIHPLKEWLRQHPESMPPGLDPNPNVSTSHQLRSGLLRMGWTRQETPTEFRLFPPGAQSVADVNQTLGSPDEEQEGEEGPYFSLEYQLRDFLAANLGSVNVNGKRLHLFVDPTGRDGVEYPSAVGPIDILAVDGEDSFFVFELKRASSPDRALGQLARYMGWVKQTIGKDKKVYGVIVAKGISNNLKFARTIVPDIYLFEYEVSFSLKSAGEPPVMSP